MIRFRACGLRLCLPIVARGSGNHARDSPTHHCDDLREGYEWLTRALAVEGDAPPDDRVRALWASGMLAWSQGDFRQAETLGTQARVLAEDNALVFGGEVSNYLLFIATDAQGRRDEAVPLGEASVAFMRDSGERARLAYVLGDVGSRLVERGDRERGEAWIEEGLALHRELGNKQGVGNKLSDLGLASHEARNMPAAVRNYAASIRWLWESGDAWYLASPIGGLAVVALDAGHAEQAARLLGAAGILRERSGGAVWPDERERLERALLGSRAALGDDVYAQAVAAGRALPLPDVVAEATAIAEMYLAHESPAHVAAPVDPFGLSRREQDVLRLLAKRSPLTAPDRCSVPSEPARPGALSYSTLSLLQVLQDPPDPEPCYRCSPSAFDFAS